MPNFFELHQGNTSKFADGLSQICELGIPTRVILDVERVSEEKLKLAIEASIDSGVRGIQTSSGFGPKVTPETIKKLISLVRGRCSVKAVGGIKKLTEVLELISSGCSEIGTSRGPELMKEFNCLNQ